MSDMMMKGRKAASYSFRCRLCLRRQGGQGEVLPFAVLPHAQAGGRCLFGRRRKQSQLKNWKGEEAAVVVRKGMGSWESR